MKGTIITIFVILGFLAIGGFIVLLLIATNTLGNKIADLNYVIEIQKQTPIQVVERNNTLVTEKIVQPNCPICPQCVCNCGDAPKGEKSAYNIYGGWATNNTWWKNQTCSAGYNCSLMG